MEKEFKGIFASNWWMLTLISTLRLILRYTGVHSITVSDNKLVINRNSQVELLKSQINIKNYPTWFAIRIHHSNPNLPKLLIFFAARPLRILDSLRSSGYTISDVKSFQLDE